MNTNGFQALYCNKDGYAEIPWTQPKKNQFSIVVRFLPDELPKEGTLFSLGDVLSVDFFQMRDSAGYIQVRGNGFCYNSENAVLPQCKNTLAGVFNSRNLKVYCNGILALEKTLPDAPDGAFCLRIGEKLSAVCIFDVTIFHRTLALPEIRQCSVKKPTNFEKRICFSENMPSADVTMYQYQIENCVYALDCGEGGFILPRVRLPEKYTISFSLFLSDKNRKEGILFRGSGFEVKIFYERGCIAPQLIIHHGGGPEVNVPRSFKRNQWINITFVFDGFKCYIYFDGMSAAIIDCGSPCKREEDISFGPFDGYMDTCTIVKYAVSQDRIGDFLQNPPGIFNQNLLYFCDFSGREFLESCHNTDLTSCGAKIVLARGTGALSGVKKEIEAPESKRTYSDFVNWQIGVLIRLLVEWIYEQFGIYPNRGNIDMEKTPWEIEINLRQFIHKEILSMPEAQDLLFEYDMIDGKKLLDLIQAMDKNGTLKKLIDYLYQEDDDQERIAEFIGEMLKAAMMAAIILAIKTMLENMQLPPKPPKMPDLPDQDDDDDKDDDEDKKKKKTDVRIKQMSLKGDMSIFMDIGGNLRAAFDIADAGEEQKTRAVFFLKNGMENPRVKVNITFKGDKDDFIISAKNEGSQVIADVKQAVSYSGSGEHQILLSVHPERFNGKYGKCTETLRWQCRSEDGKQSRFLGETDFELYFLEGKPCGPWQNTVPIECLELCADCAEYAGKSSAGFFTDYIKYINDKTTRQEHAASSPAKKSFSQIKTKKGQKSVFYIRKFSAACLSGGVGIVHNDKVYSAAVFGYLMGDTAIGTMGLCSGISWKDGNQFMDGARLLFEKGGRPEERFCPEEYIHSVITRTDDNPGETVIYDSLLGVNGLPFSVNPGFLVTGEHNSEYYREGNYLCGSYCMGLFSLQGNEWQISFGSPDVCEKTVEVNTDIAENMPETLTVGVVGPGPDGYRHTRRLNMDPEVRDHIDRPAEEDADFEEICHSISASQIDLIIADICNAIVRRQQGRATFRTLIEALYPKIPREGDTFASQRRRVTEAIADTLKERLAEANQDQYTNNLLLHLSYLAGNSPGNLRMGRGDWNRSIQDNFDPTRWFYLLNSDSECVISEKAFDEHCDTGQLIATLTGRYQDIPQIPQGQHGYYLTDRKDGIRIAKLREMGYPVNIVFKCIVDLIPGERVDLYPLIACSGNHFPHQSAGSFGDRYTAPPAFLMPIPIFYISLEAQEERWIQLI